MAVAAVSSEASTWSADHGSLDRATLAALFKSGQLQPTGIVRAVYARMRACDATGIWITLVPEADALAAAGALEALIPPRSGPDQMPLYGLPFAVKDNIDVAGLPTTAACPGFAYRPDRSAPAVARLLEAGAILIGKTNLDQFATGLVGTRSPYGVPRNVFDAARVPGGSSSGSGAAVAAGIVPFALGTDTAGGGMVPACRSLDTISVFAGSVDAALDVYRVIAGFDPADPYARRAPVALAGRAAPAPGGVTGTASGGA